MRQLRNERLSVELHTPSVKHNKQSVSMRTPVNICKLHSFRVKLLEQHNLVARVEQNPSVEQNIEVCVAQLLQEQHILARAWYRVLFPRLCYFIFSFIKVIQPVAYNYLFI